MLTALAIILPGKDSVFSNNGSSSLSFLPYKVEYLLRFPLSGQPSGVPMCIFHPRLDYLAER